MPATLGHPPAGDAPERLGADLHIGVRRGPVGIEAHAWVQAADHVVNDDPALVSTYAALSVGQAERYLSSFE